MHLTNACQQGCEEHSETSHNPVHHLISQSATLPVIVLDRKARVIQWNPAAEEAFGWSAGEARGTFFPPAPSELHNELMEDLQQIFSGGTFSRELLLRRRDGAQRDQKLSGTPLLDGTAEICGAVLVCEEVSRPKPLETELRQQEEVFRRLFVDAPLGLVMTDQEGTILQANPAFCSMLGYHPGELSGAGIFDLTHPEDRSRGQELARSCRRDALAGYSYEKRYLTKSGTPLWCNVTVSNVRDDSGETLYALAMVENIAERMTLEQERRREQEKLRRMSREMRTILDGLPDGLTLIDPDFQVVWTNRAAADFFAASTEEREGASCQRLCEQATRGVGACPGARSLRTGQVEEGVVTGADGRIWGVKAFPVVDENDRVTGVIEWTSDITEKIRLRSDAMRASRLACMGELAAGVGHEINNPNGTILMNLPILKQSWPQIEAALRECVADPDTLQIGRVPFARLREMLPAAIHDIEESAQRIRRIVNDLRDFSRQEDTREQMRFCLNQAVQTALRLCGSVIDKHTEHLFVKLDQEIPEILAGRQQIEQVIINLIVNACQALAGPEGRVELHTRFNAEQGQVELSVCDDGVGMAPEVLKRMTDPFFTTKRHQGGSGLGLSVSNRIVREHGGRLQFFSTPGAGTTAILCLPAAKGDLP